MLTILTYYHLATSTCNTIWHVFGNRFLIWTQLSNESFYHNGTACIFLDIDTVKHEYNEHA